MKSHVNSFCTYLDNWLISLPIFRLLFLDALRFNFLFPISKYQNTEQVDITNNNKITSSEKSTIYTCRWGTGTGCLWPVSPTTHKGVLAWLTRVWLEEYRMRRMHSEFSSYARIFKLELDALKFKKSKLFGSKNYFLFYTWMNKGSVERRRSLNFGTKNYFPTKRMLNICCFFRTLAQFYRKSFQKFKKIMTDVARELTVLARTKKSDFYVIRCAW